MTRVEVGKYSVLIRNDYLYFLWKIVSTRTELDNIIQKAVEDFLQYPFEEKTKAIYEELSETPITPAPDHQPPYHQYLQFIHLRDALVYKMKEALQHPVTETKFYDTPDTILNAAIRLFLIKQVTENGQS
jgi:hypothetical protein